MNENYTSLRNTNPSLYPAKHNILALKESKIASYDCSSFRK